MKKVMVVPTYWGRDSSTGWQLGDEIYDHPTPVDQEGTLGRLIDSMYLLNDQDFELVILVVVTTSEIISEVYQKVNEILKEHRPPVKTYLIGNNEIEILRDIYSKKNKEFLNKILLLSGYSNVRNMCLYIGFLLEAEVIILIDDDEVFKDEDFMNKTTEFIGRRMYGQTIDGVAGYYLNINNVYYDDIEIEPWMTFWNRFSSKSKAFDKIIGSEPRLKQTPFAFGGLMLIHRHLYRVVPFDPMLTRGEDIDYVINARMFGFSFYLDNQLSILHLPPRKEHPVWQRFRQDMYRFFYERAKISSQYEIHNMNMVTAKDFDPYPGEFLKEDLEDKVFKTNIMLALDYLSNQAIKDCQAAIKNIYLSKYDAEPRGNVFKEYLEFQKNWERLLTVARGDLYQFSRIILDSEIKSEDYKESLQTTEKDYDDICDIPFFRYITPEESKELLKICTIKEYNVEEKVLERGSLDDTLYIIKKGSVKIVAWKEKDGEEVILFKLKAGDFFGMSSLVSSKSYYHLVDIIATEPASIISIESKKFMEFISRNQNSGVKLLLTIVKETNDQQESLLDSYTDIHLKTQDISKLMNNK
jgi:CRP-like cAMP-binding protein